MDKKPITYEDAGVDVGAGNKAVDMIKKMVESTFHVNSGKVLGTLGSFSAHVELPDGKVISSSTDGVGTKLLVAQLLGIHDTIGIDLVAMCVNDLIADGVKPLFLLDYMAFWKQIPDLTCEIIKGIVEGCLQAGCSLVGGEMAELPGMYNEGIYDLSACAIGISSSVDDLILGDRVTPDMHVYGIASSGLHSNGFSLYRKLFDIDPQKPIESIASLKTYYSQINTTIGEELLRPTTIYEKIVSGLFEKYSIAGLANITGGGLIENPPRTVPDGCGIYLDPESWPRPPIFDLIQEKGNLPLREMMRTTNYGIGFVVISPDEIKEDGIYKIGHVFAGPRKTIVEI